MQNHWRRCYGGVSSRRCVIPTTLLDRLLFLTEPLSAGCGVYDSDDVIDTIKRNEAFFFLAKRQRSAITF